jgi:hypothetical protein
VLSQAVLTPVPREKPDNDGFVRFQEILCSSHISLVGASFSGSSKLASVTSIVSAQSSKVSVVPQLAQKVLVTPFEEKYFVGTPSTSSKFLRKTTAQATLWALRRVGKSYNGRCSWTRVCRLPDTSLVHTGNRLKVENLSLPLLLRQLLERYVRLYRTECRLSQGRAVPGANEAAGAYQQQHRQDTKNGLCKAAPARPVFPPGPPSECFHTTTSHSESPGPIDSSTARSYNHRKCVPREQPCRIAEERTPTPPRRHPRRGRGWLQQAHGAG